MSNSQGNDGSRPGRLPFLQMDGKLIAANMLMGALRRQAVASLGGKLDDAGFISSDNNEAGITAQEIKDLMVKLAAQGLHDVLSGGLMGDGDIKEFTLLVAKELEEMQTRRRG